MSEEPINLFLSLRALIIHLFNSYQISNLVFYKITLVSLSCSPPSTTSWTQLTLRPLGMLSVLTLTKTLTSSQILSYMDIWNLWHHFKITYQIVYTLSVLITTPASDLLPIRSGISPGKHFRKCRCKEDDRYENVIWMRWREWYALAIMNFICSDHDNFVHTVTPCKVIGFGHGCKWLVVDLTQGR